MYVAHLVFLLFLNLNCAKSCDRPSFHNTRFTTVSYEYIVPDVIVTGCISGDSPDFYEAHRVYCKGNVNVLRTEAVANVTLLQELHFVDNGVINIERKAFTNLPELQHIYLSKNNLKNVNQDVFKNLSVVSVALDANHIAFIANAAFADLYNLEYLRLDSNRLVEFTPSWFSNTPNLLSVNLNNNIISTLAPNSFSAFKKLKNVTLKSNALETIHPLAFSGVHRLDVLDLSLNRLKVLHQDVFASFRPLKDETTKRPIFRSVQMLLLQGNRLTFLPKKLLDDLTKTVNLEIYWNPWKCACHEKILQWAFADKVKINKLAPDCLRDHLNPVCVSSLSISRECVEAVDGEVVEYYLKTYRTMNVRFFTEWESCNY